MKILMVAGGTGGHIYPACTLAKKLIEKNHQVNFIGSKDRMESRLIPSLGFNFQAINVKSTYGGIFSKIKSLISILFNYFKCLKIVKDYDLVMGFGNYISIPVMLAAKTKHKKTLIHEQNSYIGLANKLLDQKVDAVIVCDDKAFKQFKNKNVYLLGNPQADKVNQILPNKEVLKEYHLDLNKKTILIFMGSLGSVTVSKVIVEYLKQIPSSYQVIYATGSNDYPWIKDITFGENVVIKQAVDVASLIKNVDLLICRAGATTICEIEASKSASILIPSPYVPNNHQYENARLLADIKAALLLEEKELCVTKLNALVDELFSNEEKIQELKENLSTFGLKDVCANTIKLMEEL